MKKKKVLHEEQSGSMTIWWVATIAAVLILVILSIYWFRFFIGNNYDFKGKNGEYHITKSNVAEIDFYQISLFFDNTEYIYPFRNHPKDLESVSIEGNILTKLNRPNGLKRIYVTQDLELSNMTNSDSVLAIASFEQVLTGDFGIYNVEIFNTYTTKYRNKTAVTCNYANDNAAVIYLKAGDETKVYSEGECIIIQGRGGNGLIKAGEKFAYTLLGVF